MTNKKTKILITGASGLLGHALCQTAAETHSVFGIYYKQKPLIEMGHWIHMDLTDIDALITYIKKIRPTSIIHAAAVASINLCQERPEETEIINVHVPTGLAQICADMNIHLGFISTDLVFDGHRAPYNEKSPPTPLNVYGDQKARAEQQVLERWPNALVCRLPLLIGFSPHSQHNFTVQMLKAIANHRPITLYKDEYRTPVDIWSAARGILQFMNNHQGLLHLGGLTRASRYELGLLSAELMGIELTAIKGVRMAETPDARLRAPDCSLDSRLAFSKGYEPLLLRKAILSTVDQLNN